ncbi:hypothetical protein ACQEVB_23410 [Pseudonocardia sp. CA-107938]|uniref:hypothetical protein n=1 Tax=Pseudonocardia sp. CA-107938 TaxID=3240021 RepID=UPI003D910BF7
MTNSTAAGTSRSSVGASPPGDLGAHVAVVDRDLDGAATFGEKLDANAVEQELAACAGDGLGVEVDLASEAGAADAIGRVVQRRGRLDIVVAAAGAR